MPARIIATCGHEIPDIGTSYATKESPGVVSHRVLCDECVRWYEDNGLILHSRDEEWEWLSMSEDEEEWR